MKKLTLAIAFLFIGLAVWAQPKVGEQAPNITQEHLNGEEFNLESLRGKYVLIDFWASWCRPCRRENVKIVPIYHKYKDASFTDGEGFTILSVSLDKNKAMWQKAIEKDKLEWEHHVSDLNGWKNKVAVAYKVKSIPSSFLIDGNGNVIAINLRSKALNNMLKSKLNANQKEEGSFWGSIWN